MKYRKRKRNYIHITHLSILHFTTLKQKSFAAQYTNRSLNL